MDFFNLFGRMGHKKTYAKMGLGNGALRVRKYLPIYYIYMCRYEGCAPSKMAPRLFSLEKINVKA